MLDNILKSFTKGRGCHAYCLVGSSDATWTGYQEITKFLKIPQSEQWQSEINPITIDQIRLLERTLNRKPLSGKYKSAYIILDQVRVEAITAMLKTLEDPPANSIIVLSTHSTQTLLPTIKSRCQVVYLGQSNQDIQIKEINSSIKSFLALEEELKTKSVDGILDLWLNSLASSVRKGDNVTQVKQLLAYKAMAKTNVNPRLLLENAFLSLGAE